MDFIKFIIIATIISIMIGCYVLENSQDISDYLSSTSLSSYDRYEIRLIDKNNVNYLNWLIPKINDTKNTNINTFISPKCPNMKIPDNQLGLTDSKNKNFGTELPWDKNMGFDEVYKSTDKDLYENTQDSTTITFY